MGVAEAVAAAEAEELGVETAEVEVVPDPPRVAVKMMFRRMKLQERPRKEAEGAA